MGLGQWRKEGVRDFNQQRGQSGIISLGKEQGSFLKFLWPETGVNFNGVMKETGEPFLQELL